MVGLLGAAHRDPNPNSTWAFQVLLALSEEWEHIKWRAWLQKPWKRAVHPEEEEEIAESAGEAEDEEGGEHHHQQEEADTGRGESLDEAEQDLAPKTHKQDHADLTLTLTLNLSLTPSFPRRILWKDPSPRQHSSPKCPTLLQSHPVV